MQTMTLRRFLGQHREGAIVHRRLGRVSAQDIANHYGTALDALVIVVGRNVYFATHDLGHMGDPIMVIEEPSTGDIEAVQRVAETYS